MLLEKLVEYANVQLATDLPPTGYQPTPIRYFIILDESGKWLGLIDTADKEAKRGQSFLAPHVKKTSGVAARLLADNGEYVLGVARNDPKKPVKLDRIVQQFDAFRELAHACATETQVPQVIAVDTFLQTVEPGIAPEWLPADFDASSNIGFRVGNTNPMDLAVVREWWSSTRAPVETGEDAADLMECIICGRNRPALTIHPFKISGIPGGQVNKDLISGNKDAFLSYGLKNSLIAPTCAECAEAYSNALNALLRNKATSLWSGGLAYAFWTDPRVPDNPFAPIALIKEPDAVPGQVAALLKAAHGGKQDALFLDPTSFYCAAFGASGARVVVKDWIDTTVGRAQESMARYFALQEMVDWDGQPGKPVPLFWLAGATVRRKETPNDVVTQALFRLALQGTPLPDDLLFMAVRRNRAEQDVTRPRAMLIRMVLDSNKPTEELKESKMDGLDPERRDPAYVCGRQLAIIDRIQYQALGDVNASVIDKYFGSASSNPGLTFPLLLRGAQFHLNKLARDKPGTKVNLQRALEDTSALLSDYPARLNLHQQGLFALGFYHQRAWDRSQSAIRNAARVAADAELASQPV